jgi:hypothetical protein
MVVTYCTAKLSDVGKTGVEKRTCECYAVVKKNTTGCFPRN